MGVLLQKAAQISSAPLAEDESGSEDDSSSLASSRTSIISPDKKGSVPGSPRAVKRGKVLGKPDMCRIRTPSRVTAAQAQSSSPYFAGVSMSSISSESDYAIPPDACSLDSDYSEPEHKVQRTSAYSCESAGPVSAAQTHTVETHAAAEGNSAARRRRPQEVLEKSGYLLKMGRQVQAWKRRWFILRNGRILYYKSPVRWNPCRPSRLPVPPAPEFSVCFAAQSEVARKPQGQIQLNSCCGIVRGEGAQTFQVSGDLLGGLFSRSELGGFPALREPILISSAAMLSHCAGSAFSPHVFLPFCLSS